MERTLIAPLLISTLLLAGCSSTPPPSASVSFGALMQNPLFAERYWDELTDRMANILIVEKDKLTPQLRTTVDEIRRKALNEAQAATRKKREGKYGQFITVSELTEGWTLLNGSTLFLSPDFTTYPGPSLRIYLTTMIDPRESTFPDKTSIDLGKLESPYGAQQYRVPPTTKEGNFRSVVLWDTKLERLYGFSQI